MAVMAGYVGKLGVVSGGEPVGRITIMDPNDQGTELGTINCTSGPKFELAIKARELGQLVEVDVLATSTPMVADKVRLL